jgi:hypothetical protein
MKKPLPAAVVAGKVQRYATAGFKWTFVSQRKGMDGTID